MFISFSKNVQCTDFEATDMHFKLFENEVRDVLERSWESLRHNVISIELIAGAQG